MSQTHHLIRRKGTWYYRRRVPTALLETVGRKYFQFSLNTSDLKEAKKRRDVEDLKATHHFELAEQSVASAAPEQAGNGHAVSTVRQSDLTKMVLNYVEQSDNPQGYHEFIDLGSNSRDIQAPLSGDPSAKYQPFCFRNGAIEAACSAVTAVPEPSAAAIVLPPVLLILAFGTLNRRRVRS